MNLVQFNKFTQNGSITVHVDFEKGAKTQTIQYVYFYVKDTELAR